MSRCGCSTPSCGCSNLNSNNIVNNIVNNHYHPRHGMMHSSHSCGCQAHATHVHTHTCGCAPKPSCGCGPNVSYMASGCGCGCNNGNYTGNVPANAPVGSYTLVEQLPPGKYMVTKADNVANGDLFAGASQIAKTIGTEFTILADTDMKFVATSVMNQNICVRFTKVD